MGESSHAEPAFVGGLHRGVGLIIGGN